MHSGQVLCELGGERQDIRLNFQSAELSVIIQSCRVERECESETHSIHDRAVSRVSCQAVVLALQLQHHVCCSAALRINQAKAQGILLDAALHANTA